MVRCQNRKNQTIKELQSSGSEDFRGIAVYEESFGIYRFRGFLLVFLWDFLYNARDNKDIDIKQYNILSKIDKPLFMRWGTDNEMIIDKPDELVKKVKQIIENKQSDVNYIEGANHSYNEKEEILATQILEFIQKQRR